MGEISLKIELRRRIEELADIAEVDLEIDYSDKSQYPKLRHSIEINSGRLRVTFFEYKEVKEVKKVKESGTPYKIKLNGMVFNEKGEIE